MSALWRPPAPEPLSPNRALWRAMTSGRRDLLDLLPADAFETDIAPLGYSRRGVLLVNEPTLVRAVFDGRMPAFPKNDLFVGALAPLIGGGVFIADGDAWARQRRMIEPGFGQLRMRRAEKPIAAAIDAFEARMDAAAADGRTIALDVELSRLTADVMCRTIFSIPLDSDLAGAVFRDFDVFQETVANVRLGRLLLGRPFADAPQPKPAREAATRIRKAISALLAPRIAPGAEPQDDLAGDLIAARDPETGAGFSETELIDQLAVFFLAGHETTASTATWALVLLHGAPDYAARCRAEIAAAPADDNGAKLRSIQNLLRESMRLYAPGPFLPRVARADGELGGRRFKRGTMIMISPWIIHRHRAYWPDADRFDPDRFDKESPRAGRTGAYLPFGLGPRACVGAAFATLEGAAILTRILRRYAATLTAPERIRPTAKLTIRPDQGIETRFDRR